MNLQILWSLWNVITIIRGYFNEAAPSEVTLKRMGKIGFYLIPAKTIKHEPYT